MNASFVIRNATASDIPDFRKIAFATWPSAYGSLLSKEQMNKGHQFFMADVNGTVFGFASVSDEGNNRFKLNKLYVIPDTQNIGLLVYW